MTEFKREHDRYIVVKTKHLNETQKSQLYAALDQNIVDTVECVVVESDWPIYDDVWDMVQRLAEDRPHRLDEMEAMLQDAQALIEDHKRLAEELASCQRISEDRARQRDELLNENHALLNSKELISAVRCNYPDVENLSDAEAKETLRNLCRMILKGEG